MNLNDITKSGQKVFLVMGVMDTGSGSLTFPEDFNLKGVWTDETDARAHADLLNRESQGLPERQEGEDFLIPDFEVSDDEVFDVYDLDVLTKG